MYRLRKSRQKICGEASIEWPDYFKLGHYPIFEKVDNFDEHGLVFFTTIIFQTTPGSMVEHIKMTAQEAKQKSEVIRKIFSTHEQVKPTPFLRTAGLDCEFVFVRNRSKHRDATVYHEFVGFFKRHPKVKKTDCAKIG
jgi:hypothetical protein